MRASAGSRRGRRRRGLRLRGSTASGASAPRRSTAATASCKVLVTTAAVVDFRAILADCTPRCLRGCSCTAYASAKPSGAAWTSTLEDLRAFLNFNRDFMCVLPLQILEDSLVLPQAIWAFILIVTLFHTLRSVKCAGCHSRCCSPWRRRHRLEECRIIVLEFMHFRKKTA